MSKQKTKEDNYYLRSQFSKFDYSPTRIKTCNSFLAKGGKDRLDVELSKEISKYVFVSPKILDSDHVTDENTFWEKAHLSFGYAFNIKDKRETDDILKLSKNFENRIKDRLEKVDLPQVRNGFIIEFYSLCKMFSSIKRKKQKQRKLSGNKSAKDTKNKHIIPKTYLGNFGYVDSPNSRVVHLFSTKAPPPKEVLDTNTFILQEESIFSSRIESETGRVEDQFNRIIRSFVTSDQMFAKDGTEYNVDINESVLTLNSFRTKIILSVFINTLSLKTKPDIIYSELPDVAGKLLDKAIDKIILNKSTDLCYREWNFIFLDSEKEFAFTREPITYFGRINTEREQDIFLPLSRTVGLHIKGRYHKYVKGMPEPKIIFQGDKYVKNYLLNIRFEKEKEKLEYFYSPFAKDIYKI